MNYSAMIDLIFRLYKTHPSFAIGRATDSNKYWNYIASPTIFITTVIKDILKTVEDISKKRFLDIGAGNNLLCVIFEIVGFTETQGLERDKLLVRLSGDLRQNRLMYGDLLKYKNYKKYDVLYSYMPIKDRKLMEKGILYITSKMKKGAVFYFISATDMENFLFSNEFSHIGLHEYDSVYKFIKK